MLICFVYVSDIYHLLRMFLHSFPGARNQQDARLACKLVVTEAVGHDSSLEFNKTGIRKRKSTKNYKKFAKC